MGLCSQSWTKLSFGGNANVIVLAFCTYFSRSEQQNSPPALVVGKHVANTMGRALPGARRRTSFCGCLLATKSPTCEWERHVFLPSADTRGLRVLGRLFLSRIVFRGGTTTTETRLQQAAALCCKRQLYAAVQFGALQDLRRLLSFVPEIAHEAAVGAAGP